MISAFIHLLIVLLLLIGAMATYAAWRKGEHQKELIRQIFLFCLYFGGCNLSLALPHLVFGGNLYLMALGYDLAVIFLFLGLASVMKIELAISGAPPAKIKLYANSFLMAGLSVLVLQIFYFRLPVIYPSGLILWNANIVAGWITGAAGLLLALAWIGELAENWPHNLALKEKVKSFLIIGGTIFLGLSGVAYYPARSQLQIVLAFALVFAGTIFLVAAFLIPKRKDSTDNEAGWQ